MHGEKRSKPIGLIGRINPEGTLLDGQTVKTRTVYQMLLDKYGDENVIIVDTDNYKRRPLAVMSETLGCLSKCDDIVVSLSRNGRRVFFPLLYASAKYKNKRIFHNLIGGWLADDLDTFPSWIKYLNSFAINWVESEKLVDKLAAKGVLNASYLPNFKNIELVNEQDIESTEFPEDKPLSLCMFSRIMEEKGVTDAIIAINDLNARHGFEKYTLNLYGPIDPEYSTKLDELLQTNKSVQYCGCIDPDESVNTIKNYYALLFPTRWSLEGIPGTIIDALSSAVPIVASRWQYYDEMLEDGKTGYSFEIGDQQGLESAIERIAESRDAISQFKRNCLKKAHEYSPEQAFAAITDYIDG